MDGCTPHHPLLLSLSQNRTNPPHRYFYLSRGFTLSLTHTKTTTITPQSTTYSPSHTNHQPPQSPPPPRYFAFLEECHDPKACTVLLRGASKDVLNEIERNLQDALQVGG